MCLYELVFTVFTWEKLASLLGLARCHKHTLFSLVSYDFNANNRFDIDILSIYLTILLEECLIRAAFVFGHSIGEDIKL